MAGLLIAVIPTQRGAGDGTRTRNRSLTRRVLYQLSYTSPSPDPDFHTDLTGEKDRQTRDYLARRDQNQENNNLNFSLEFIPRKDVFLLGRANMIECSWSFRFKHEELSGLPVRNRRFQDQNRASRIADPAPGWLGAAARTQ